LQTYTLQIQYAARWAGAVDIAAGDGAVYTFHASLKGAPSSERESSLLTTYWSESKTQHPSRVHLPRIAQRCTVQLCLGPFRFVVVRECGSGWIRHFPNPETPTPNPQPWTQHPTPQIRTLGPKPYTLTPQGASERVRVWVDSALLIDEWTSLSATALSATVCPSPTPSSSSSLLLSRLELSDTQVYEP